MTPAPVCSAFMRGQKPPTVPARGHIRISLIYVVVFMLNVAREIPSCYSFSLAFIYLFLLFGNVGMIKKGLIFCFHQQLLE